MPRFRILYLRDSEIDRFRQSPPKEHPYQLMPRQYEEVGEIEAAGAYAAWNELQGGAAEERSIRKMGVGDVLEPAGERPLLCNFWGFEEAEWHLPPAAADSPLPGPGVSGQQAGPVNQVYS